MVNESVKKWLTERGFADRLNREEGYINYDKDIWNANLSIL